MNIETLLQEVVYAAGALVREHAFEHGTVEWKKKDDPVTVLDRMVERIIKEQILTQMPANFIGEEYGLEDHQAKITFIIDPIDGTKSFVKKDFLSAVSVAVEQNGVLTAGCVYDFMRDIMYLGVDGKNYLWYQRKKIALPQKQAFSTINLHLDNIDKSLLSKLEAQQEISPMKRGGSIALMMAHLAFGCYDGIYVGPQQKGNCWDVAAGYYLLQNENLFITDAYGKPFDYHHPQEGFIALRKEIMPSIINILCPEPSVIGRVEKHGLDQICG